MKDDNPFRAREFNADLNRYVNMQNGVLDLDQGVLLSHSPDLFFTWKLPFDYDPNVKCPTIDRVLFQLLTPEQIELLEEVAGYCFVIYQYKKMFFFVGGNDTGKSTIANLIRQLVGERNCSSVEIQEMGARFKKAELFGKLANIASDIPSNPVKYIGILKKVTGGDAVNAERKGQDPFEFVSQATILFTANRLPFIKDADDAWWERVIIMEFGNMIPEDQRDKQLMEKLETELPGWFNKVLNGRKRLLNRGRFMGQGKDRSQKMWLSWCLTDNDKARMMVEQGIPVTTVLKTYPKVSKATAYNWRKRAIEKGILQADSLLHDRVYVPEEVEA